MRAGREEMMPLMGRFGYGCCGIIYWLSHPDVSAIDGTFVLVYCAIDVSAIDVSLLALLCFFIAIDGKSKISGRANTKTQMITFPGKFYHF